MRVFTAKSPAWATALLFAAPAMAQSLDQRRANCQSAAQNSPDRRIADCTAVMKSGRVTGANLATVFYNRGNAYTTQKDYARAISDYDQAIRIDPRDASAFNNRGLTYGRQRDYARAISDFDQAIRIRPQFALPFYNRGLAYFSLADWGRAISSYSQAIRINPLYADAFTNRGLSRILVDDNDGARADFNEATGIRNMRRRPTAAASPNTVLAKPPWGDADKARAFAIDPRIRQ